MSMRNRYGMLRVDSGGEKNSPKLLKLAAGNKRVENATSCFQPPVSPLRLRASAFERFQFSGHKIFRDYDGEEESLSQLPVPV